MRPTSPLSLCFVLGLALLFSLAGCVQVRTTSNVAEGYTGRPTRVFVAIRPGPTSRMGETVANELAPRLTAALAEHGVTAQAVVITGLELDEEELGERVRTFGAEALLIIAHTQSTTTMSSPFSTAEAEQVYETALVDLAEERTVWRARIEAAMGVGGSSSVVASHLSARLIETLVADQLIQP